MKGLISGGGGVGGLISGIKKLIQNEQIKNKLRLTYNAIQIRFPFTYAFVL